MINNKSKINAFRIQVNYLRMSDLNRSYRQCPRDNRTYNITNLEHIWMISYLSTMSWFNWRTTAHLWSKKWNLHTFIPQSFFLPLRHLKNMYIILCFHQKYATLQDDCNIGRVLKLILRIWVKWTHEAG